MIRTVLVCVLLSLMISCGNKSGDNQTTGNVAGQDDATQVDAELSANPDYQKGLTLVVNSNCLTCHKVDEKVNGPSYRDVANKYSGAPDTIISYLAGKIVKGGSGTWGEVPMTPHSDLSREDAEAMVKYILLLKN